MTMDSIGVFTPEQARELWQDYQTRKQLNPHVQHNYPQRRPIDEPSPHRVFVKNTEETEACPPYGCVQVIGTEVVGGLTVVKVQRPTSTSGEFLFNSQFEIPAGETGWAFRFGVVIAIGDPPATANTVYQPIVDSWEIEEGGSLFTVFGEHNAATNGLIGKFTGGGGGAPRIWFTIVSVECVSADEIILTVEPTWFTGGCTAAIPDEDSYGYVLVEDVCQILQYYTAEWLVGKTGSATYMYPRSGYCEPKWLVDEICGQPSCA